MSHQDETDASPEVNAEVNGDVDARVLPPEREEEDGVPSVDQIIGTFMTEPSLWPVLIVILGAVGAFGGAMLVLVSVDRNPFAAAALVLLLGMTIDVAVRSRREAGLRSLARFVALLWLVAAGFAGLAVWTGIAF